MRGPFAVARKHGNTASPFSTVGSIAGYARVKNNPHGTPASLSPNIP